MGQPPLIARTEKDGRGRLWTLTIAGEAELVYLLNPRGVIVVTHVFVPKEARGRGVGRALVDEIAKAARESRRALVCECDCARRAAASTLNAA